MHLKLADKRQYDPWSSHVTVVILTAQYQCALREVTLSEVRRRTNGPFAFINEQYDSLYAL